MKITIIDCGISNLRSVQKAFEKVGVSTQTSRDPNVIEAAEKLVLPGVGAFGQGMENLGKNRLVEPILRHVKNGKPIIGICLGMQLLFSESEELGHHRGLNLLKGRLRRFPSTVKVPHVGWNQAHARRSSPLLKGINGGSYFYFVHSYYLEPEENVTLTTTDYGIEFPSSIEKDNIFGIQFHPEKSQEKGLTILKNFADL
ncbi:MAG: imidazole glycerol phosphate synthase subunit HisH [Bacteroidota bacterium]